MKKEGSLYISSKSERVRTRSLINVEFCPGVFSCTCCPTKILTIKSFKTCKYLNSPLEFLMFSQESFRFHQWCSKFGTGIEHGLAIPNPSDHLPKKTELMNNILKLLYLTFGDSRRVSCTRRISSRLVHSRWLWSCLVLLANFVESRALSATIVKSRALSSTLVLPSSILRLSHAR